MTILQNFRQSVNNKYKISGKIQTATSFFKNHVDIGEAIVNVVSNTGIAGFKFHLPKREQVKFQSDVTDHYTDLNNPVQDHIARKPITITMNGLQGEYFYSVNQIEDILALITPTMTIVKEFMPRLTDATMALKTLKNRATAAMSFDKKIADAMGQKYGLGGKLKSLWNELKTVPNDVNGVDLFQIMQDLYKLKSAQTRAFLFFEALWKSEALFTVETTWKRYDNMTVIDVAPLRDENADITDFTVTFKQMQFTTSLVRDLNNAAGRTREQLAAMSNKGVDKGKEVGV